MPCLTAAARAGPFPRLPSQTCVLAQAQLFDQSLITALIGLLQVIEQRTTRGDQLQQATTRVVVFLVGLEVLGEVGDPLRVDRHLHFSASSVAGRTAVGLDELSFALESNRHRSVSALFQMKDPRGLELARTHLAERHDRSALHG